MSGGAIPSVSRFRMTTIWPAVTPGLLEGRLADGMLDELAHPLGYRGLLRELLGSGGGRAVGLPWSDAVEHRFWREYTTYARDAVPAEVVPRDASRFVVPLHHAGAGARPPDRPPWKLSCHAFLYPFGPAVVLHAEYPHPDRRAAGEDLSVPLDGLVEACYDLRDGAGAGDAAIWSAFARERCAALAPRYASDGDGVRLGAPLTVATILEAEVRELDAGLRDRVLNALTVWPERPVWRDARLVERLDVRLGPRHAARGRLIHAARRGRAVWFPDGFSAGGSLSEMHRRLSFVTMQTEMLARFLVATGEHDRPLAALPPSWSDWAQEAARAIGPLYSGKLAAADSTSPARQVDSSGGREAIDRVRGSFGLAALH